MHPYQYFFGLFRLFLGYQKDNFEVEHVKTLIGIISQVR